MSNLILWQDAFQELIETTSRLLFILKRWDKIPTSSWTQLHVIRHLLSRDVQLFQRLKEFLRNHNQPITMSLSIFHDKRLMISEEWFSLTNELFNIQIEKSWNLSPLSFREWENLFLQTRNEMCQYISQSLRGGEIQRYCCSQLTYELLRHTKAHIRRYLLGNTTTLIQEAEKIENDRQELVIPTEMFRTFLNAVQSLPVRRILHINSRSGFYALATWMNGQETTSVDSNIVLLDKQVTIIENQRSLLSQQIIAPVNGNNVVPVFTGVLDQAPNLLRFTGLENNNYTGIVINDFLSPLINSQINAFFKKLDLLIAKPGFILINKLEKTQKEWKNFAKYLQDKEGNYVSLTEESELKTVNSSCIDQIEQLFRLFKWKILLKTTYYAEGPIITWLLTIPEFSDKSGYDMEQG